MKTIYVESKDIQLGDKSLGTVKSVQMSANANMYAEKINVWVGISSDSQTLANKSVEVSCDSTGIVWADVESAVLSQLGLVKSQNQAPDSPLMP